MCNRTKEDMKGILSHVIPRSILLSSNTYSVNYATGKTTGHSNAGFRGLCVKCESILSINGEQDFNPKWHTYFLQNGINYENINSGFFNDKTTNKIHHCLVSIAWRFAVLSEIACCNKYEGVILRLCL